jgi:hypothetical protein
MKQFNFKRSSYFLLLFLLALVSADTRAQGVAELRQKFRELGLKPIPVNRAEAKAGSTLPFAPVKNAADLRRISLDKTDNGKMDDVLRMVSEVVSAKKGSGSVWEDYARKGLRKEQLVIANRKVRVTAFSATTALRDEAAARLTAIGFETVLHSDKVLCGWLPLASLPLVNSIASIQRIMASPEITVSSGAINAQSDVAQYSNLVRQNRLVNGSGVKVGIISNSFNRAGGMAASITAGELPGPGNPNGFTKPVQIVRDALPTEWVGSIPDEGRAIAEIIHDISPGAELAFYAPFDGQGIAMAAAFRSLAANGCQIIVDDVFGLISPFYQDDIAAKVIDSLVAKGFTIFSAAGNFGSGESNQLWRFYEKPFTADLFELDGVFGYFHNFDTAANSFFPLLPIVLDSSSGTKNLNFILQWDEPWGSNCAGCPSSRNDMFLLFYNTNFQLLTFSEPFNPGDAINVSFKTFTGSNTAIFVAVYQPYDETFATPIAGRVKLLYNTTRGTSLSSAFGNNLFINTPTIVASDNARSCISVAASAWYNTPAGAALWNTNFAGRPASDGSGFVPTTPVPQSPIVGYVGAPSVIFRADSTLFVTPSSLGGSPTLFDYFGNRFAQPEFRQNPVITAPDGAQTTFFGITVRNLPPSLKFPFFFGTSAAVPAAAGAGALLLSASKKTLTPVQIKNYLTTTALDMDNPYVNGQNTNPADPLFSRGFDFASGFGLLQADKALEQYIRDAGIQSLTLTPQCQSSNERRWVINNPNGFAVSVTLSVSGSLSRLQGQTAFTSGAKTFLAPPGNFNFFTERNSLLTTARLTWRPATGSGSSQAISTMSAGAWTNCAAARIAAEPGKTEGGISVYPNPSPVGLFTVAFTAKASGRGSIAIFDMANGLVYSENRAFPSGNNQFTLQVPGLAKGTYLLIITTGKQTETRRIVLQ